MCWELCIKEEKNAMNQRFRRIFVECGLPNTACFVTGKFKNKFNSKAQLNSCTIFGANRERDLTRTVNVTPSRSFGIFATMTLQNSWKNILK